MGLAVEADPCPANGSLLRSILLFPARLNHSK